MERWEGKTALVTGASAGIGAAVCVALADAGMKVVGLARRAPLVEKLQSRVKGKGSIMGRQCDVSQPHEVAAVFQWLDSLGGVDLLVNNAGVFFPGGMTDIGPKPTPEEDLLKCIDVNVKGVVMCSRHAVASMRRRGVDGHIVNINSIAGHYIPFDTMFNVYPGSKHAVTGITASLDNELCDFGSKIKTTSISPGLVATDMVLAELDGAPLTAPALRPEDVAEAVRYVVSTPPSVNINELTITPVGGKRL
ncbi:farnesol dehydrogenase-like [Leguminivora glycinivorella]|uniref:farnesol dehydrogenase-like n=1 Tax=Leguminivora glycinivorella TaxID=1035111 RepID=UPI00200C6922|nr:farnesol dehydrogenase-like [Leguminivora glycinivorella]